MNFESHLNNNNSNNNNFKRLVEIKCAKNLFVEKKGIFNSTHCLSENFTAKF